MNWMPCWLVQELERGHVSFSPDQQASLVVVLQIVIACRHEFMNTLWTKMTVRNLSPVRIRGFILGQAPARLAVRTILPGWFDHLAKTFFFS